MEASESRRNDEYVDDKNNEPSLLRDYVNKYIFSLILKIALLGEGHNPYHIIEEIHKG